MVLSGTMISAIFRLHIFLLEIPANQTVHHEKQKIATGTASAALTARAARITVKPLHPWRHRAEPSKSGAQYQSGPRPHKQVFRSTCTTIFAGCFFLRPQPCAGRDQRQLVLVVKNIAVGVDGKIIVHAHRPPGGRLRFKQLDPGSFTKEEVTMKRST